MILHQIVEAFDAELDRLHKLRAIIAGLLETPSDVVIEQNAGQQDELPVSTPDPETAPKRIRRPRLAARAVPRPKPLKGQLVEPTPLSGPIPKGPVVVMPAALAKELASKSAPRVAKAEKVPEPGSLGSMIRALHLERLA